MFVLGVSWLAVWLSATGEAGKSALALGLVPFIPGALIKAALAAMLLPGIVLGALAVSLFRDKSTRPRFSFASAASACTTKRGQLIYGASIGVLVYIIRSWGGYPDAVAFAVLLLNMAAPTIDYYTQPRVFGHREAKDD